MRAYRVVEGYIQLRFTDTGEVVQGGEKFPLSRFTIVVDPTDKATMEYLIRDLDLQFYEVHPITEAPRYLTHELN